jgi:hypothetical protein
MVFLLFLLAGFFLMVMGMVLGVAGTAFVLKRRQRRAVLEKYKTSDEDLAAHFGTLNLGKYQFFRTFGRPSLNLFSYLDYSCFSQTRRLAPSRSSKPVSLGRGPQEPLKCFKLLPFSSPRPPNHLPLRRKNFPIRKI